MPRTFIDKEKRLIDTIDVQSPFKESDLVDIDNKVSTIDEKIVALTQAVNIGTRLLDKIKNYETKRNSNRS